MTDIVIYLSILLSKNFYDKQWIPCTPQVSNEHGYVRLMVVKDKNMEGENSLINKTDLSTVWFCHLLKVWSCDWWTYSDIHNRLPNVQMGIRFLYRNVSNSHKEWLQCAFLKESTQYIWPFKKFSVFAEI